VVQVNELDECLDTGSLTDLQLTHPLGNLTGVPAQAYHEGMAEFLILTSILVDSEDDGFLSSETSG
jgi:hypothetical protein